MSRRNYRVMLSSTFIDLEEHRNIAARALRGHGLEVIWMEDKFLSPTNDVIGESIAKVEDADAYLCLVGKRYGEPILCSERNPGELSATALECNRALEKGLPVASILFSEDYRVSDKNNEFDQEKRAKLEDLRKLLRRHRVVGEIDGPEEFAEKAQLAAFALLNDLKENEAILAARPSGDAVSPAEPVQTARLVPPKPPAMHFAVRFAQGMPFVGRARELDEIASWALSNDPMLVVEAIGGMGKSMLALHWTTEEAPGLLPDLAGRLWYSFYEEGASMRDFCVQALAYIEHAPPSDFQQMNRHELRLRLVQRLGEKPWLLVLDGLERVLIAYHRYDAAQITDEEADASPAGERDPNLCIRPDDDEILRDLAGVQPSKMLVSTRNMPSALRFRGDVLRAGVRPINLNGLTGDDAERLMRQSGVRGDGAQMRAYLERNFGAHPLMVGVITGLVLEYAPAPGDFDHWLSDPQGASALNLASIDGLVGKRNHVLKVAFEGLEPEVKKLLGQLSFFSNAVKYSTLAVLNPRLSPRPSKISNPEDEFVLSSQRDDRKAAYEAYLTALEAWQKSPEQGDAERWLRGALRLLQRRGLVVREAATASYDLHPLVRGFIRANLSEGDRAETGAATADFAREQAPSRVSRDSSGDDLDAYFEVVRLLLLGGKISQAAEILHVAIDSACARAGCVRTHFELLAQLFEQGFTASKQQVPDAYVGLLSNQLGTAAGRLGRHQDALSAYRLDLQVTLAQHRSLYDLCVGLLNIASAELHLGRIAAAERVLHLSKSVAELGGVRSVAGTQYRRFVHNFHRGELDWRRHTPLVSLDNIDAFEGPDYIQSWLAKRSVEIEAKAGTLTIQKVDFALAQADVKSDMRSTFNILGEKARLLMTLGEPTLANEAYIEAIRLGREIDAPVYNLEAEYATGLTQLGQIQTAFEDAEHLSQLREPPHLRLAELWLALGERDKAREQVLLAYPKAWADGPPHAFHWDLQDCRAVLLALGEPEPQLPSASPGELPPFPFEAAVLKRIEDEKAKKREKDEATGRKAEADDDLVDIRFLDDIPEY